MKMTIDYNKAGSGMVEAGEYEVIASEFSVETARTGNEMVQFNYLIRDDVDQKCQGQEIRFDNFVWTENSLWRLQSAAKAAQVPEGYDIEGPEDFGDVLKGKAMRVVVEMEEATNGKKYPRVKQFKASEAPAPKAKSTDTGKQQKDEAIDISDDDLPF